MNDAAAIRFRIEFVAAEPQRPDPAALGDEARAAVDALRAAGYDVQPAYTGAMGGAEFYEQLRALAEGGAAHPAIVLALITSVAAPIVSVLGERLKKPSAPAAPATPPPPVIVIVGGARTAVHNPQITGDELLRQLLAADPTLAERATPQTEVVIRAAVPARPQRRRR